MDTNPNVTVRVDGSKLSDAQAAQVLGNVSQALGKLEHASQGAPEQGSTPSLNNLLPQSWASRNAPVVVFVMLAAFLVSSISWVVPHIGKQLLVSHTAQIHKSASAPIRSSLDAALQAEAEGLLQRAAAGDSAAADQIVAQSGELGWQDPANAPNGSIHCRGNQCPGHAHARSIPPGATRAR